jgi:flagellar motor switch protein FliG
MGIMAATETKPAGPRMSGIRKAAIFMLSVGEEAGAKVLRNLSEADAERLTREVARLSSVSNEEVDSVLLEADQLITARQYYLEGGMEFAQKMLTKAFGPDISRALLDRIAKSMGGDTASFDAMQKMDPKQIARLVYNEYPQTIALVVSHLVPAQAAALLGALPAEMRAEVAKRVANLDHISPEIIVRISQMIGRRLQAVGEISRESYGGVRAVAEILNRLDSNIGEKILEEISKDDATVAETIRNLMFVFDDILKINTEGMRTVVSKVDRKVLAIALKGTSDAIRHHFTQTMSVRAAEMLNEDIETLGPIRIKEVTAAQQEIIAQVRKLQAEGALHIGDSGVEEYIS